MTSLLLAESKITTLLQTYQIFLHLGLGHPLWSSDLLKNKVFQRNNFYKCFIVFLDHIDWNVKESHL